MSVRVSPVSKGAALLIMVVGIFTYVFVNDIAGIAFLMLGIVLYWLLYRFARRVEREAKEVKEATRQPERAKPALTGTWISGSSPKSWLPGNRPAPR